MKNKSVIISVSSAVLLILLLVWLAVLQYNWLSEVSFSQKKQLETSVKAATINIAAEFDREISDLYNLLNLIAGDSIKAVSTDLQNRIKQADESQVVNKWVNSIWLTNPKDSVIWKLELDGKLSLVDSEKDKNYWKTRIKSGELTQMGSFKRVLLGVDLLNLAEEKPYLFFSAKSIVSEIEKKLSSSFSTNSGFKINSKNKDKFNSEKKKSRISQFEYKFDTNEEITGQASINIFVELNKDTLETNLIHKWPSLYFGENYQDLYQIAILSNKKEIFLQSDSSFPKEKWISDSVDVKQSLGSIRFDSFVFVQSDTKTNLMTHSISGINVSRSKSNFDFSDDDSFTTKTKPSKLNKDSLFELTIIKSPDAINEKNRSYQIWVKSKAGSLAEYVNQTKFRNLTLSFSILGILGLGLVLMIWNANRLQEIAHQKMEFVAGVSHELKTPLAVIRSAAENVADGIIKNEDQLKKYGRLIQQEGLRLSNLIEQILEFSGIQSGNLPLKLKDINIDEFSTKLEHEFSKELEDKEVKLEWFKTPNLPILSIDEAYIKAAISNLITNAVKYSDKEQRIQVRWFKTEWKNKSALGISVQDFGRGISSKDKKQLFKPFFRADSVRDDQIRGNGLGLYLVKRWIKAHKGVVDVDSRLGFGSTFTIIIPLEV